MILYRLSKSHFADSAWTGYGARQFGGRWNHKGIAAVYLATSVSLALLEILVHLNDDDILAAYSLFSIEVDEKEIQRLEAVSLPENWRDVITPTSTMDIGSEWLTSHSSLGLMVPSTLVPTEYNVMLNPKHALYAGSLASVKRLDFAFDPRLN